MGLPLHVQESSILMR